MSKNDEEEDDDEVVIAILIGLGLTRKESQVILTDLSDEQKKEIVRDGEIKSETKPKKTDGFANALILGGFTPAIAKMISNSLIPDEKVQEIILKGQTPCRFETKQDSKVDDKYCLPEQGNIYAKEDPNRPKIPLHDHCRCWWVDPITGKSLGVF